MKKDFSQEFERRKLHVEIIVKDVLSKKYALFCSSAEYEDDFYRVLGVKFDSPAIQTLQLAKYLYENNFVLNSYRELVRQVDVSFSFTSEMPGTESVSVCILAEVDIIQGAAANTQVNMSLVDVHELSHKLSLSPVSSAEAALGVAKLLCEHHTLHA